MRDAKNLETMSGMEYLASAPKGETIKDMVVYDGEIFIATGNHIYILKDKKRLEVVE